MLLEDFPFEPGFRLMDGDLLNKVAAEPAYSVDTTVAATGTTPETAYNLRATVTAVTAGGDLAGLRLPPQKTGRILYISNHTATDKRIYTFEEELVNGGASVDLVFGEALIVIGMASNGWLALACRIA